jgi:hypothetical protein
VRCKFRFAYAAALISCLGGCASGGEDPSPSNPGADPGSIEGSEQSALVAPPPQEVSAGERVLLMVDGPGGEKTESWISAQAAVSQGYTLLDLSDDWTPYIFAEQRDAAGQQLPNRYRRVFIGLANDQLDSDGEPLEPGEKNYLELYGIAPSLAVLRERFLRSEQETCVNPDGHAALEAVETVSYTSPAQMKQDAARVARTLKELEAARKKAKVATLEELVQQQPKLAPKLELVQKRAAEQVAMAEVEKRLVCEGLLKVAEPAAPGARAKRPDASLHTPGVYDEPMRLAVRKFQQKNKIYEANYLRKKTMDALSRPSLHNDHDSLERVMRERIMAVAGVLEDGSADTKNGPPQYLSASGEKKPLPNLSDEYTQTVMTQLGLTSPEASLAFMKRHGDFKRLLAAIKLPPRPEYYSKHMELSIVVDRGDVWYDPPFDENDKWRAQPRSRYPSLSLFMDYRGERVPLVRWRTTIGGWRSEQAPDGYEYYKYKGSDTGPRVMRNIISGPVWIAPESTPIRSLAKSKKVEGVWQPVVNYDELGPGYLSAYGLVAGYFVIPGENGAPDQDRGIRAHGSSDYLSIYQPDRYSHGCHRLPNHLAIRLYDFLLQHRNMKVNGDAPMNFWRQFLSGERVYEMRIPSRGYVYELDPPLPVNVLKGTIKGELQEPIEGFVPKPGVRYPGPPPDQKPAEGEEADVVTSASVRATTGASRGGPL